MPLQLTVNTYAVLADSILSSLFPLYTETRYFQTVRSTLPGALD
jgi:hypothetical protein